MYITIRLLVAIAVTFAVVGDTDNAFSRPLPESFARISQLNTHRLPDVMVGTDVPDLKFTRTAPGREGECVVRRPDGREDFSLVSYNTLAPQNCRS